jgi:hypothetical protein
MQFSRVIIINNGIIKNLRRKAIEEMNLQTTLQRHLHHEFLALVHEIV